MICYNESYAIPTLIRYNINFQNGKRFSEWLIKFRLDTFVQED